MNPRKKRKEVLQYSVAPILITLVLKMVFYQMSTLKVSAILEKKSLIMCIEE